MWRLVWARVRLDWRRSLATFLAVLFSVTSFIVLTGATTTQQVEALETAADSWRSSVDILVRPTGARNSVELETGRVRPNFLSDTYGGITVEQWHQIAAIPGVEVAAPIAMVGQILAPVSVPLDLTEFISPSGTQLLRINMQGISRGETFPARSAYLYVTDNPLLPPMEAVWARWAPDFTESTGPIEIIDGEPTFPCVPLQWIQVPAANALNLPEFNDRPLYPFDLAAWDTFCISRADLDQNGFVVDIPMVVPLTVAAIDPQSETELVGLSSAVTVGRYLHDDDMITFGPSPFVDEDWATEEARSPITPALISLTAPAADFALVAEVEELPEQAIIGLRQFDPRVVTQARKTDQVAVVVEADALAAVGQRFISTSTIYDDLLRTLIPSRNSETSVNSGDLGEIRACHIFRPGPVRLETTEYAITAQRAPAQGIIGLAGSGLICDDAGLGFYPLPGTITAAPFRNQTRFFVAYDWNWLTNLIFDIVGAFSPEATMAKSGTPGVILPMETYITPPTLAADEFTRNLINSDEFQSNLNTADYLIPDISLVIPLANLIELNSIQSFPTLEHDFSLVAPISAVRVRVDGVTGWDEVSQLRIALVAEEITETTGLDVDVMVGAGLINQPVTLQGAGDTPDLNLLERWAQFGIVLAVVDQIDRKSVLLFGLILTSGVLTIASVASAAAAAQRTDLGTLAAIGYKPRQLWGYLLAQQTGLGLFAGILGALVSWPIAAALGAHITFERALMAVPIATALTALAALPSAYSASRAYPLTLLKPTVRAGKRAFPVTSAIRMGAVSMLRRPLRLLRASLAIAIAIAAVTILVVITTTFQGIVAGSLLGEAIILQVRTADIIAGIILTILGLVCLGMTMRFAHLEDSSDWAVLSAVGWNSKLVTTAVLTQGALAGLIGAIIGLLIAIGLTALLVGTGNLTAIILPAALVAFGIAILAALTALIPALALQNQPLAQTLTRD